MYFQLIKCILSFSYDNSGSFEVVSPSKKFVLFDYIFSYKNANKTHFSTHFLICSYLLVKIHIGPI